MKENEKGEVWRNYPEAGLPEGILEGMKRVRAEAVKSMMEKFEADFWTGPLGARTGEDGREVAWNTVTMEYQYIDTGERYVQPRVPLGRRLWWWFRSSVLYRFRAVWRAMRDPGCTEPPDDFDD